MKNAVREKFLNKEQTIGTFLDFGSGEVAEALGLAGFDYFIVDTEHSPFDLPETIACVKSAEVRGIVPFARIKHIDRGNVLKMLDIGVKGLIVPGIRKKEEIEKLIEFGKYTPLGNRGFCPTRCSGWGYDDSMADGILAYTQRCNQDTMLLPQCETVDCLNMIEDVVAVKGIDGIFIGPFDLSLDMGIPAQFDDPRFKAALDRILNACKKAGKPCFVFAPNLPTAKKRLEQGFDSVTYSADLNQLIDTFSRDLSELRKK